MKQKKCMIVETLNPITVLEKQTTDDGFVRVSGCFGVCGIMNENGRTYNKSNYGEQVKRLQAIIAENGLLGELEHPNSMNINLENVSHKIESIEMKENGEVWGTIVLANTPKGKIAQAIVEMGSPLFISSRAKGRIDEKGNVTLEELKTYDLVGTPGFSQAILRKDQKFESLNESLALIIDENEAEETEATVETTENKNQENENTMEITKDAFEALVKRVDALEQENEQLKENAKQQIISLSNYIEEELMPEFAKSQQAAVAESRTFVETKFGPLFERWCIEEFAPTIQSYIKEEFAGHIEGWLKEEYTPEVQKWITEDFAGTLQDWITEHYSEELSGWLQNEVISEVYREVQTKIDESLKTTKSSKLSAIDETLNFLESMKTSSEKNQGAFVASVVNEGHAEDAMEKLQVVKSMPAKYRTLWEASTQQVKNAILERAKVYNFNSSEVVERFWESVDFTKAAENVNTVNENMSEYESRLRSQIRQFRKY